MPLEPIDESDLDLRDKFLQKKEIDFAQENKNALEGDAIADKAIVEKKEDAAEKDDTYSKIVSKIKTQTPLTTDDEVATDAGQAGRLIDNQSRINNLVDMAMQKGVFHAVKVAKHLDNNYVLDEFHDKLVMDEFHDALIAKGLIERDM